MRTLRIRDDGSYYSMRVEHMEFRTPKNQTEFVCTSVPLGYILDIHIVPVLGQESTITLAFDKIDAPMYITKTFRMVYD